MGAGWRDISPWERALSCPRSRCSSEICSPSKNINFFTDRPQCNFFVFQVDSCKKVYIEIKISLLIHHSSLGDVLPRMRMELGSTPLKISFVRFFGNCFFFRNLVEIILENIYAKDGFEPSHLCSNVFSFRAELQILLVVHENLTIHT